MRDPVTAFYYPSATLPGLTLAKSILLFDELHMMDRPAFSFRLHGSNFGMVGADSPLRQTEEAFRREGFPLYVHRAPGGLVSGDLLERVEADIRDQNFLRSFQDGLRNSRRFRDLQIAPGNYAGGDTNETLVEKFGRLDIGSLINPEAVLQNSKGKPFDASTSEGCLRFFLINATECSAVLNYALNLGVQQGMTPLSDAKPSSALVACKYIRAISRLNSETPNEVPVTDLSLAVLDEVLPTENLEGLKITELLRYRRESTKAREAFLEYIVALQAKIGDVPGGEDYGKFVSHMIASEVRPAARQYRGKLESIRDKLFGTVAKDALTGGAGAVVGTAGVEVFGDLSWEKLLTVGAAATVAVGISVAKATIDALVETRAAKRECALSYLLEIEP